MMYMIISGYDYRVSHSAARALYKFPHGKISFVSNEALFQFDTHYLSQIVTN